jgi:exonuclease 3'-5' domain-containing protein 1
MTSLCQALISYSPHAALYIDLEGVDLCREGSLSILTLLIDTGIPTIRVCLIDVHSLGSQAFNTTGIKQKTLRDILQDEKIPKVFFDVRNDSDALFAHFGVALQGVEDVQLMESATRTTTRSRKYLNGLAKCVEKCVLYGSDLASWKLAKEKGERLFKAEHGGSYEVFKQRPIPDEIISYCVGDVQCLPKLWDRFRWKTNKWRDLVNEETKKRVSASQKPEYQPHGPDRTLAPWSEDQNRTLDEWNYVPPPRDYFDEDYFDDDWDDGRGDNDYEDWTRADWQGPPS